MSDLGVYLHLPFCSRRCPYCDFVSSAGATHLIPQYLAALEDELAVRREHLGPRPLASVYLGGGTPSLLSPAQIGRLIEAVTGAFPPVSDLEVSLEGNPESLTAVDMERLAVAGVTRLIVGVQSLDPQDLAVLGRAHSARQARECLLRAAEAGFSSVGADLICGIPGQSVSSWTGTLEQSLALPLQHLSVYALSLEPGRRLADGTTTIDEATTDEAAAMLGLARRLAGEAGFGHYEISNYARPGHESRHNLRYWALQDYLGLGAGAHSLIGGERWENEPELLRYMSARAQGGDWRRGVARLSTEERRGERAFLGLRVLAGVDLAAYRQLEGVDLLALYGAEIRRLNEQGLVCLGNGRLRLTSRGLPLANEVFCQFV